MIKHAATPLTISAPEGVFKRLQEKLTDPARRKTYEDWARSPETRENIELLKDVFCRPAEGPIPGDHAIWVLGFNSGAWAVCDSIMSLKPTSPQIPEPETTYGDDDDGVAKAAK